MKYVWCVMVICFDEEGIVDTQVSSNCYADVKNACEFVKSRATIFFDDSLNGYTIYSDNRVTMYKIKPLKIE